ncbi:MAG: Enoyl-CoA hydratase/isomerase [Mycobacterium sp.]|jgi:2-(1,2-epoxy-1,2-dihydrophenyl)acetyl-CoA isomerase|nr:Enoyl-CoA hydratase/isomerase [Mycobacterium sp.]
MTPKYLVDGEVTSQLRDGTLHVTLDRAEKRNALNAAMFATLKQVFDAAAMTNDIRCLILRASGPIFSAGADLAEPSSRTVGAYRYVSSVGRVVLSLSELAVPTVALVGGPAVGVSCGLAMACDFTILSSDARLSFPFARRGLVPDGGATWLLPRAIGSKRAKQVLMLGEDVDAATAHALGIASAVVAPEDLDAEGERMARLLSTGPTVSLGLMKRLIDDAETATLGEALESEARCQHITRTVDDASEAIDAFFAKREPHFTGWGTANRAKSDGRDGGVQ